MICSDLRFWRIIGHRVKNELEVSGKLWKMQSRKALHLVAYVCFAGIVTLSKLLSLNFYICKMGIMVIPLIPRGLF